MVFLLLHLFDLFFKLLDVFGYHDVFQVNACAHFVEHINGFIRQETVGDVPVAQANAVFDGFIAVRNVVKLFVLRLDVAQDVDGNLAAWAAAPPTRTPTSPAARPPPPRPPAAPRRG